MAIVATVLAVAGCAYQPSFSFPIEEGSVGAGRVAFIAHRCHRCHSISGDTMPEIADAATPLFELGGETTEVVAYSDLVTSIINPDHRISEEYQEEVLGQSLAPFGSPMQPRYIDTMTVAQLIDLVAYLDSHYSYAEPLEP